MSFKDKTSSINIKNQILSISNYLFQDFYKSNAVCFDNSSNLNLLNKTGIVLSIKWIGNKWLDNWPLKTF